MFGIQVVTPGQQAPAEPTLSRHARRLPASKMALTQAQEATAPTTV